MNRATELAADECEGESVDADAEALLFVCPPANESGDPPEGPSAVNSIALAVGVVPKLDTDPWSFSQSNCDAYDTSAPSGLTSSAVWIEGGERTCAR